MQLRFAMVILGAMVLPPVIDRGVNATAAESEAVAKFVAPFLDDQTIAVVHIDVNGLDADAAIDRVAKAAKVDVQFLAGPRKALDEGLTAFRNAHVNDIYAVVSISDLPNPGIFVLVPRAGANDAELKSALERIGTEVVEPLDGAMFAGGKKTFARLRGLKPKAMPGLETALTAVGGSPLQVAVVPTADQRRIVTEMMPALPKEVGGGPSTILTKGIRWAALGVQTTPKLAFKIVAKSDDGASAMALAAVIDRGLDWAGKQQTPFANFAGLRRALTPKVADDRLTIAVDESNVGVASELTTMANKARQAAARSQSANNLKQIALAWHNYHDRNKAFPTTIKSNDGKPLLSWRVAILPYLDQNDLYKQFKLDEPWDSELNKKLIDKMPKSLLSPSQKVGGGKTTYLAPTGMADKAHIGALGVRIQDITDGTSNTIMIVESNDDAAVIWTKPDDFIVDPKNPIKGLVGHFDNIFLAAFADGSVRALAQAIVPANLLAMFTRDGGEVVNP